MLSYGVVERVAQAALNQTKKLGPIVTQLHHLKDKQSGLTFCVRHVTSLELKKAALRDPDAPANPFEKPDVDMVVSDVQLPHHVVMLNKFPVIHNHVLLVTKVFQSQRDPLDYEDFVAMSHCVRGGVEDGDKWLAFYNCGDLSGRSQPHKHIQLVPFPLDEGSSDIGKVLQENPHVFPFVYAFSPIASWNDPHALHRTYESLLKQCQQEIAPRTTDSHNFVMAPHYMLVVPRSATDAFGLDLNSLAFALSFLSPNEEGVRTLEREGPIQAMQRVAFAKSFM